DFHVEDTFFPAHANSCDLGGGDQKGRLGPLSLHSLGRDPCCGSNFRQRGPRITVGGEQLRGGGDNARTRLLGLLLAQLRPVSAGLHGIDSGNTVMNTTRTKLTASPGRAQCRRSSLPASLSTGTSRRCWLLLETSPLVATTYAS